MTLRHLILHNFWLKLFSIVSAAVIWMAIHYSIHDELNSLVPEYIRVPVSVKTASGDKRVFRYSPHEVVVRAVGKDTALLRATQNDIRVNLDLTDFAERGAVQRRLKAETPPGVVILEILPSTVDVQQVSP